MRDFSQCRLPFTCRDVKLQCLISLENFIHPDTSIASWNLTAMEACSRFRR
jgi:hypothetical protein